MTQFVRLALLCSVGLSAYVSGSHRAHALPILSENVITNVGPALTLYPDNVNPKKFYYMPNSSRISRDKNGIPTFSFTYYGLDNPQSTEGGALMVYIGRMTSDTEQAAALKSFAAANPGAQLTVLPIKESTIGLTSAGAVAPVLKPIFTDFNFSQHAGRAEDEIGINAVLTRVGAKVFKASLLNESGAVFKFDMCYKVDGLGPEMNGEIWIDMDRVYQQFVAKATLGILWFKIDIDTVISKLIKTQNIRWKITGGNARDEDYIREATNRIVDRMFKPELSSSTAGTKTVWDAATPFVLNATYNRDQQSGTEHWMIQKQSIETHEFCVPMTINDIQEFKNKCVIDADVNNVR